MNQQANKGRRDNCENGYPASQGVCKPAHQRSSENRNATAPAIAKTPIEETQVSLRQNAGEWLRAMLMPQQILSDQAARPPRPRRWATSHQERPD